MKSTRIFALLSIVAALAYACVGEDPAAQPVVVSDSGTPIGDGSTNPGEDGGGSNDGGGGDAAPGCTSCDGGCFDLATHPANCGACGNVCGTKECAQSKCASKLIFVTSATHNANFGGISGADQLCADHAKAMGFTGQFKAWISAPGANLAAVDRLQHSLLPYKNAKGETIAADWSALTDGNLDAAIQYTEDASAVTAVFGVWTNTYPTGLLNDPERTCASWTSQVASTGQSQTQGRDGICTQQGGLWTQSGAPGCDQLRRLYCVEQ